MSNIIPDFFNRHIAIATVIFSDSDKLSLRDHTVTQPRVLYGYGYTRGSGTGRVGFLDTGRVRVRVEKNRHGYGSGRKIMYPQSSNVIVTLIFA